MAERPPRRRRVTWADSPPDIPSEALEERPPSPPREALEERPSSSPREALEERPPSVPREALEERPPSRPRVAWEEVGAPQKVSPPPEPSEMSLIRHLEIDASWLPVYEFGKGHVDFIVAFIKNPEKEESKKMQFVQSICDLCDTSRGHGLSQGLDLFCQIYQLADTIKVLLEEEPRDELRTPLRQIGMHAIAELSSVDKVLEGKETSLLEACFSSVFLLPPEEEMQGLGCDLYHVTMQTMDNMLNRLVLQCCVSTVSELLQNVFQMLMTFTNSSRACVQERAMGRMAMLSHLLSNLLKADPNDDRHASCAEIEIPILGRLLGHLVLLLSSKEEEIRYLALDALCSLFKVKYQQHCATLPKENAQLQGDWEAKATSLRSSPSTTHVAMLFEEYLQPSERTDMVLLFIEAMTDSSIFDKEAARNPLDVVTGNPELWLVDVPKITNCIHENLESINMAPARQKVQSLLLLMAKRSLGQVVSTLLTIAPPGDSSALALWEVMLSMPQTVQNVLKELLIQLWDLKSRLFCTYREDYCLVRLAMLASSDLGDKEFAPTYTAFRFLKEERPAMLSLVLRGIMTLSERDEMARKMKVILPDLLQVLQYGNKAIKMKALVIFRTVMARLKRKEASPIAVLLAKFLLPFFDDELSQLRESSISLFRDLMKMVVWNDKRKMRNMVRLGLLPLFFHMSDQMQSVAKAAGEALFGAAELLRWKQLKHLVQTEQAWRIGEILLEDRSRAQEYLNQSLPYLKNAQASLREAAVGFIGLAARSLRDPSKEKLAEICSAIEPLEEDSEPSVCSLAAQTVCILSTPRKQPKSRWTLRALCCWSR